MSASPRHQDQTKPLPHNLDAERGVLGSMMLAGVEVCAEAEPLGVEAFYLSAHGTIYAALMAAWSLGRPADFITLTHALRDSGQLDAVGGPAYVSELFSFVPTAANSAYYIGIVREQAALRQALLESQRCAELAAAAGSDPQEIADALELAASNVREIAADPGQANQWDNRGDVIEVMDGIERAHQRKGQLMGLATGFRGLDAMTGGLQAAEMIVIAARPSMGKTSIAMGIAEHVAIRLKKPVGIFSLEMSKKQLLQRSICSRALVNLQHVRDGYLSERDFPCLTQAAGTLAAAPLYIDDTASLSIGDVKARARQMHKASGGLAVIIIDYLQLMRSTSKRAQENRQVEVAEISAGCKALAKELDIPVIVLAQLNRQPEARSGGKPKLSDLRESGAIEQDADFVGFLHRAEYYAATEEEKEACAGEAELIVAKQRNGPVGDVKLAFLKQFTRFEDRAEERPVRAAKVGQPLPTDDGPVVRPVNEEDFG